MPEKLPFGPAVGALLKIGSAGVYGVFATFKVGSDLITARFPLLVGPGSDTTPLRFDMLDADPLACSSPTPTAVPTASPTPAPTTPATLGPTRPLTKAGETEAPSASPARSPSVSSSASSSWNPASTSAPSTAAIGAGELARAKDLVPAASVNEIRAADLDGDGILSEDELQELDSAVAAAAGATTPTASSGGDDEKGSNVSAGIIVAIVVAIAAASAIVYGATRGPPARTILGQGTEDHLPLQVPNPTYAANAAEPTAATTGNRYFPDDDSAEA